MPPYRLGRHWNTIQAYLIPGIEDDIGELSEEMKKFMGICELLIDEKMFAKYRWCGNGRPPSSRISLFKAYILKVMRNYPYTKTLIAAVRESPTVRRLCGWESVADIPDKSQFSRAFKAFATLCDPEDLPQLVVVDGGRGQLDFAYQALKDLGLDGKMPIIGIAKRLEELIRPGDPNPLFLDKNSPGLKTIMQLRDEAHRFGITFHRSLRSKHQTQTELSQIKGIGEKTSQKLLQHFKSVARVKKATEEELSAVIGKSAARKVSSHFSSN